MISICRLFELISKANNEETYPDISRTSATGVQPKLTPVNLSPEEIPTCRRRRNLNVTERNKSFPTESATSTKTVYLFIYFA